MHIYSKAGSEQFNIYLDETLQELSKEVAHAVGNPFIALILAGGYGRGEGACVLRKGKESPYNDFDLFLVVKEKITLSNQVLDITRKYEQRLGIEVDIGKPLTIEMIKHFPHQLMWQDLLESHCVILGPTDILTRNAPSYLTEKLPRVEALRLLLNRGSGLLQAIMHRVALDQEKKTELPDPDFIRRNKEKCTLALGDSLLISHQLYAPPLETRTKTLEEHIKEYSIADPAQILSLYQQAALFKTHPDSLSLEQPSLDELLETAKFWIEIILYSEKKRVTKDWKDPREYANDHFIREVDQHTLKNRLRNLIKNLKRRKVSSLYPREELYRTLVLLLDNPSPQTESWKKLADSFLKEWYNYN